MKNRTIITVALIIGFIFAGCKKDNPVEPIPTPVEKIEVVINDIPFQTEMYYRIPYTLKTWEWEKDGLKLQQIVVLDDNSKTELLTINQSELPFIFKDPLGQNPFVTYDNISNYYLSIQLPIPLAQAKPIKVSHSFMFRDTVQNKDVAVEGGSFSPRLSESPLVISSPVKGNNWAFINQSTMDYHFYMLFFIDGKIARGERFAFDNLKLNSEMTDILNGDPKVNESYFNYKDTLYAVANGTVISIKDGRPENNGDAHNVPLNTIDEYGGNYLILDIGGGRYAFYCHCVPNSFMVNTGDVIKEGDPIALLGNSGNSDVPHLHFQITDGTDVLFSNGLPFVLKKYTKVGDFGTGPTAPTIVTNAMMEQYSIVNFE
ncbi:MAG: M23 family metallopeptidase [Bacteroidetes bacterium]|nr:M23 family metallopeptidase [Bacteroidota bacterium]MBU1114332.1 M23 family metallopeptidase [Bacteroidota bacterium]MBU1797110.1 M23 family metallopeptidase [Bacteroidota bacterium]